MQAMLLAAGFGTRLRPYSLLRPKPLFPVLNVPLLSILLERLAGAGCRRVVVNGHHLADQIKSAVADRPGVTFQYEPEILGTGGSLRRALDRFDDGPLLVMNGDIYHDIDLRALYEYHLASPLPVTMAMHDYPRFNSVVVRGERVCGFSVGEKRPGDVLLAFSGIHVLDRSVIERIPEQGFFHVIDLYSCLAEEEQIGCLRIDGCFWRDIGTPEDYLELHRELLTRKDAPMPWCVSSRAQVAEDAQLLEWGSIGPGAVIGSGATMARCVVWDNVIVKPGQECMDMIVCAAAPA